MGTNYDIRCLDCGENASVSASWAPIHSYIIQAIIQNAEKFSGLAGLSHHFAMEYLGVRIPIDWMAKHATHRLRPVSQYGDVDGTCAKDFICEHCKQRLGTCDKDVGHEWPCGKREATTR